MASCVGARCLGVVVKIEKLNIPMLDRFAAKDLMCRQSLNVSRAAFEQPRISDLNLRQTILFISSMYKFLQISSRIFPSMIFRQQSPTRGQSGLIIGA
jgi:hypothetical protein